MRLIGFILLFFMSFPNKANTLKIASDIWCPYICEDKKNPGYIIELIYDIFEPHDINVEFDKAPLARGIKLVKSNEIDMVLGLTDEHITQNKLNKSNVSVGVFSNDFFVNGNNKWRFKSNSDLSIYLSSGSKIGIIKGYEYGNFINLLINEKPNYFHISHGGSPLLQNIDMLYKNRIDILLDTKNTVLYNTQSNNNKLIYAGTQGDPVFLYIGLSDSINPEYKKMLDEGIVSFRKSGKLAILLNKYGISDWEI